MALGIVALAGGTVAAVAATSGGLLVAARRDAAASSLGRERLDALRAGPRDDGADTVVAAGALFTRTWTTTPGRGSPDRFVVTLAWSGHGVTLAGEAMP